MLDQLVTRTWGSAPVSRARSNVAIVLYLAAGLCGALLARFGDGGVRLFVLVFIVLGVTLALYRWRVAGGIASRPSNTAWRVVLAVTFVVGCAVLAIAAGGLREAHLYRQRTGEGLKFAWVGVGLVVANGLLGGAAFASVRLASTSRELTVRRSFLGLAVVIIAILVAADAFTVWVESRGDRCIGPCE